MRRDEVGEERKRGKLEGRERREGKERGWEGRREGGGRLNSH